MTENYDIESAIARIENHLDNSMDVLQKIRNSSELKHQIFEIQNMIIQCLQSGNKLLVAGNGWSAADAQHFAAELSIRYNQERKPLPWISLPLSMSSATAGANDYGYAHAIARELNAVGVELDVFTGISTSGNSENILHAIEAAKKKGLKTVALLGRDGGMIKDVADISFIVPSEKTAHIQEAHITIIHTICEEIDRVFGEPKPQNI